MFFFIMIIEKSIVEDAELDNNALFSAPLRLCVGIFEDKLDIYGGQNEYDIDH